MSEATENRPFNFFTPLRFGILLALLIFATFPQVILGLQTFVVRDFGFFSYPLAHFQRDCFWRGEIPFWNPYNFCGVPFLAQWNTMPLYPPALIYLTLPLEWSLSFFCLLHLWFAGLGMYFLARKWTGNNFAAAFAGIVFSFNGLMLNLIMWPSHLATFAWMPWVILAVERTLRDGGKKIILAALAGAFQMLAGGPEIIFFTWILLLAFWFQQLATAGAPRKKIFFRFPVVVALIIALAAVQLLPFLDLVAHSQRGMGFADLRWSLPLRGWANFLVPMAFGNTWDTGVFFQHNQGWTSSYYLGIGALWLALMVCGSWRNFAGSKSKIPLLAAAAAVAFIFALGENTPVYPALRKLLPQLSLVTYPVKFLVVVVFIAPLLAAFALAQLQQIKNRLFSCGAILFSLLVGILFWIRLWPLPGDETSAAMQNGISRVAFLLLTGAILFFLARKSESAISRIAPLTLILIAWLDVVTHEPVQNPGASPAIYGPKIEAAHFEPRPALGGSRALVTPMAASMFVHIPLGGPQESFLANRLGGSENCNLLDALPKTDGFFSLAPREEDAFASWFYGATNNDFPALEDFLGVSQITAPDKIYKWQPRKTFLPLVTAGQKPVFLDDADTLRALVQTNFNGREIVFLPPEERRFVSGTNQAFATILDSKFTDETVDVVVQAAEPSLVVVAQTYYHDWRATTDGKPSKLLRANVAFQAVQIPAGRHHIRLAYEDRAFEIGAAISIPAWLGCLTCLALFKMKRKKNSGRRWTNI